MFFMPRPTGDISPYSPSYVPIGGHKLPHLPYPVDALEPVISKKSLEIHYHVLHKNYVQRLNETEIALQQGRMTGDFSLVDYYSRQLAFNGSGHILHSVFWTNMTPEPIGYPCPLISQQIRLAFQSFEGFKSQFSALAEKMSGSAWTALVWNPAWQRMELLPIQRHENLTQWGSIPLLVIDVWEHAYYLDYQHRRTAYINRWWSVVNWPDVERRLIDAMNARLPLEST
jgi:Fe-Mn family superoxide dismutase